jgi:tetratricopeptide (TPR) repeat protein
MRDHPKDIAAMRLLARASARMGQFDVADGIYQRLGPSHMQAEDFYVVGLSLQREGGHDQASVAFEAAYRRDSKHPATLNEIAHDKARAGRYYEAADFARKLAEIPGWQARGSELVGQFLTERGEPEEVVHALTRALDQGTATQNLADHARLSLVIARTQLSLAKPAEALKLLEHDFPSDSKHEASWLLSRVYLQMGDKTRATAALTSASGFGDHDPTLPELAPFVGSARCAKCHEEIHQAQRSSRHARTYQTVHTLSDLKAPTVGIPDKADSTVSHSYRELDNHVEVSTRTDHDTYRAIIEFVVGSGDRGMTPVGREASGDWRELRLSLYGDHNAWDTTSGHPATPAEPKEFLGQPLSRDSVFRCLDCHTTDVRSVRDHVGPAANERGIGCERCHGPGGNHLQAVALKFEDLAIARPTLASAEQITLLCARCHSPKNQVITPDQKTSVRFQGTTLTWSKCYSASRSLSCLSCHDPHHDAKTDVAHYEARCLACHSADSAARTYRFAKLPDGTKRVPCPVNPTGDCIKCHMPTVPDAIPHSPFTDHFIRVHRSSH